MYLSLIISGGNALAIGRPGSGKHPGIVMRIGVKHLAGGRFPYLYRTIFAARSDARAIGRPGRIPGSVSMALVGAHMRAKLGFPDMHRGIKLLRGSEARAVR